jgi:hypothetical protein
VLGLVAWLADWRHGPLWVEGVLIGLFALFWLIQTRDLWDQGLRERGAIDPAAVSAGVSRRRDR